MLELHYAPTPNGWKVTIMLEECGLPYRILPVDFAAGDQLKADFLAINPNGKIPILVDNGAEDAPLNIFESGAILLYLAEKTGCFLPVSAARKSSVLQWVFWQVGHLGPMGGQVKHFMLFPEGNEYSLRRYKNEYDRLLGVLNYQLLKTEYLGSSEYSIADMAVVPWVLSYRTFGFDLAADFPAVRRWLDVLKQRPALRRGIDVAKESRQLEIKPPTESAKQIMFNQTSRLFKK